MTQYDALIIGAGHNALVTAAYLAKAGRRVLVLERRYVVGGAAATEELWPGFQVNTGSNDAGLFLPQIVADLDLARHGLEFVESPALTHALLPGAPSLTLWRDGQRTQEEIAHLAPQDAAKFPAFARLLCRASEILQATLTRTPPTLPDYNLGELLPWAGVGLKLRRLGGREMMEFLRLLPMPVSEFLDEWFENPALKGALSLGGVTGSMQGPFAAGTALMLLHNAIGAPEGAVRASRFVRGGTGALSEALAAAARGYGAEIRPDSSVSQILLEDGQATGVLLESGEQFTSKNVISGVDPTTTFFKLVGPYHLEAQFVRDIRGIKYRGSTARVILALEGLPHFSGEPGPARLGGHIVLCPDPVYLEQAYDDAKYGRLSKHPALDMVIPTLTDPSLAPAGRHILSIDVRYAPYHLRGTDWDAVRENLGDRVVGLLSEVTPGIEDQILHRRIITPLDYEREYGLPEGSIYHSQMGLDQLLIMRPVGGFARYRTPVENLFLCGSGTHPGGGVTGAPGYNAARAVLKGQA